MGDNAELITPDGARVRYRVVGHGPRALVLVHGWMTSGAVFDDLLAALDPARVTAIVPDLVGTGASSRPRTGYALLRYAADVMAVIEASGLERPVVVGHSMGGQIAQLVAAASPGALAGLVLVNPVPLAGLALPPEARGLFERAANDAGKLGTILDLATLALSPEARARLVEVAVDVDAAALRESLDAWTAGGFEERLADIDAPTLVVATDDPFLPRELLQAQVADAIRGARLEHLPGAGHYPTNEAPKALATILERFVAERISPRVGPSPWSDRGSPGEGEPKRRGGDVRNRIPRAGEAGAPSLPPGSSTPGGIVPGRTAPRASRG